MESQIPNLTLIPHSHHLAGSASPGVSLSLIPSLSLTPHAHALPPLSPIAATATSRMRMDPATVTSHMDPA